jgi:hypothetical protein
MVEAEPAPGPTEAGHHLVGDQQDAVARADLGDRRPVVVGRDDRPSVAPTIGSARNAATRPAPASRIAASSSAASRLAVTE